MFNMIKGSKIDNDITLKEGYSIVDDNLIIANVSAEKISKLIESNIDLLKNEDLFLFIEVPYNLKTKIIENGKEIEKTVHDIQYNNVFYMDNINAEKCKNILNKYYDILINDNNTFFGIGTMDDNYEIGKYDYNIMSFYSNISLNKYEEILRNNNLKKYDKIETYWDLSTKEKDEDEMYYENNKNIYDVIKELEKDGLYDAGEKLKREYYN